LGGLEATYNDVKRSNQLQGGRGWEKNGILKRKFEGALKKNGSRHTSYAENVSWAQSRDWGKTNPVGQRKGKTNQKHAHRMKKKTFRQS